MSVMSQSGDFYIRYHIQDGGSTDGTAGILEKWKKRVDGGEYPIFCKGISFSYHVEPDSGMYDAINRGFRHILDTDGESIMTWINADDLLAPGSLGAIASFLECKPDARFLGGRTAVMSENGFLVSIGNPIARMRKDICAGFFDKGKLGFIQQEGVFWTSDLWNAAGGLDGSLRYAGDFDLWRRLATHAPFHSLDTITGIHRKRRGQLSESFTRYADEIRECLKQGQPDVRDERDYGGYYKFTKQTNCWTYRPYDFELDASFTEGIVFAKVALRQLRKSRLLPWYLTSDGWRMRFLRDTLISLQKRLKDQ